MLFKIFYFQIRSVYNCLNVQQCVLVCLIKFVINSLLMLIEIQATYILSKCLNIVIMTIQNI